MKTNINNDNMEAIERKVYNVAEVANIMGISRNSAYTLFREPGFPAIHLGKRLLISKNAFDEWLTHAHEHEYL